MQGARPRASLNRLLTLAAPRPTHNISHVKTEEEHKASNLSWQINLLIRLPYKGWAMKSKIRYHNICFTNTWISLVWQKFGDDMIFTPTIILSNVCIWWPRKQGRSSYTSRKVWFLEYITEYPCTVTQEQTFNLHHNIIITNDIYSHFEYQHYFDVCWLALCHISCWCCLYIPPMTSTNSEPAIARKGTWASVATALASRVFPQPGGPSSKAPFGTLAPSWRYRSGFWK